MARDRLPELLRRSSTSVGSTNGSLLVAVSPSTQSASVSASGGKEMAEQSGLAVDAILNPYSEIRVHLTEIAANLETMNRMAQAINIRNYNENKMDEIRNRNLKLGSLLMNKFKEFKADLPPDNDFCLEARMKRTLFYGLHQSYVQIWSKNEEFLQNYERKLKKNLQMHSKIINCNATEEEIEELIANKTTNLFVGNILEETEKERKTLRDMMDRYSELKKLEKSIEEVHALFLRIHTLVAEQSEVIQRVEFHAQQASAYAEQGADKLSDAERLKKKAYKKKIMLLTIAVIVLVVLILIGIFL